MKSLVFILIAIFFSSCSKDDLNTEPEKIQSIVPIIKTGDSGTVVVNLQNALLKLLDLGIFKTFDAPNSPTTEYLQQLTAQFKVECTNQVFGEATKQLIFIFQVQQGLGDNLYGLVETTTAAKLNELLSTFGLIGYTY